jgi:hypothetical protein
MPPPELPKPQGELLLIHYETPECVADFAFDPSNETLWATQQQVADAFGIDRSLGCGCYIIPCTCVKNPSSPIDHHLSPGRERNF